MDSRNVTARQLAFVTGKIVSNGIVFGKYTNIMSKALHGVINSRIAWDTAVKLTKEARSELRFWTSHAKKLNSRMFISSVKVPNVFIYSDASDFACASFISIDGSPAAHSNFSPLEMQQSSTLRELVSVQYAIHSCFFLPILCNGTVKLYTDNKAVTYMIDSGSNKPHLNRIAK